MYEYPPAAAVVAAADVAAAAATGGLETNMNPEKIPPAIGLQGDAKADCTTE
jgi:hypothetical protein